MKKAVGLLIIVSFILAGVCSAGAEKIGFIDIKRVIATSEAGKEATAELKKFVDAKKIQIQEKETVLKNMKSDLEKQQAVITEDAFKAKEATYQKKLRDYKRFIEDANEEMRVKEQRLFKTLVPEVFRIANGIGNKAGYACIMDISTAGLVFHSTKNDLTKKVVEEYNKEYNSKKK